MATLHSLEVGTPESHTETEGLVSLAQGQMRILMRGSDLPM